MLNPIAPADKEAEFVGFDVSKDTIVAAWHREGKRITFANRPDAIAKFLKHHIEGRDVARLVLEPTGGYERVLFDALRAARLPAERIHANKAKAFARMAGLAAKTDALDAGMLAAYAAQPDPGIKGRRHKRVEIPQDSAREALRDLMARRMQLNAMLHAEQCRRGQAFDPSVRKMIGEMIAVLEGQKRKLDGLIDKAIAKRDDLVRDRKLMTSFNGVGKVTANAFLSLVPEAGRLNNKQIASLIGLAPFNRDSGKRRSKARIQSGRDYARHCLYMAAVTASQHNTVLRPFYERLLAKGKPQKVALVAVMRKIAVILNAIIRSQQSWKHAKNA